MQVRSTVTNASAVPLLSDLVKVTNRAFGIIGRRSFAASFLRNRGSGPQSVHLAAHRALTARLPARRLPRPVPHPLPLPDGNAPVPAWANDPAVGLRLPPADGNHEPLRSMAWQVHTYGAGEIIPPTGPPGSMAHTPSAQTPRPA